MPPIDLDDVAVQSLTYRDSPSADRDRAAAAARGSRSTAESVLIETCHRVELITAGRPREADARVASIPGARELRGRDAVRRAFEVVAGFDSAVVAEEQLLRQARDAHADALARRSAGPVLNELLRRTLRFGRRVRTHAAPGSDRSLADRGARWLAERMPSAGRVTVVGTGEMGRLAAQHLHEAGYAITVVSRSAERGAALVRDALAGGADLHVGELTERLVAAADGIVIAVRARQPTLTGSHLAGGARPWVLDLSTPSAVTSEAAAALGERILDVDGLGRLATTSRPLRPAAERRLRAELEDEVDRFVEWLESRRRIDAVIVLRAEAEAVRRRHLARLERRAALDGAQVAAVDAAMGAMLDDLLHGPTLAVKRGGADAAAVRRLFGLEGR